MTENITVTNIQTTNSLRVDSEYKYHTVLHFDSESIPALEAFKEYEVSISVPKKHRSLDANSYYWVLLTKLSKVVQNSLPAMHNLMLRRYGYPETVADQLVKVLLPDTAEAEKTALEAETFHIKPTSETEWDEDLNTMRVYIMMRGSHTYNTQEFGNLLNGLISECKEVGMNDSDIASPYEKQKLKELYGVSL